MGNAKCQWVEGFCDLESFNKALLENPESLATKSTRMVIPLTRSMVNHHMDGKGFT
jgi:hypothetical protein